jgi:hypothetical protein
MYQYTPELDRWSRLGRFPGNARSFAIGVTYNGLGYIGFGANELGYLNDLWSYDPETRAWNQLASCACTGRRHPAMLALNNKIYVGLATMPAVTETTGGSTISLLMHGLRLQTFRVPRVTILSNL